MFCGAIMILTLEEDALNVYFSEINSHHNTITDLRRRIIFLKFFFLKRPIWSFHNYKVCHNKIYLFPTGSNSPLEGDVYLLLPLIRAVHMDW